MNLIDYIKENYSTLPKSTINGDECVIFKCVSSYDGGWGHHSYEGYGVTEDGKVVWIYSSGCSCNGSCGVETAHEGSTKFLEINQEFEYLDPQAVDFYGLQENFTDY